MRGLKPVPCTGSFFIRDGHGKSRKDKETMTLGTGTAPTNDATPKPGEQSGAEPQAPKPTADTGDPAGSDATTFSQSDVDRIAGDARTKGRDTATAKMLQELGFADMAAAKASIDASKAAKLAEMSEVERLTSQLADMGSAAEERDSLQLQTTAYAEAIQAQVTAQVKALKIPKHITELFEVMSPIDQLAYITKNQKQFAKPQAPNTNVGDGGTAKAPTLSERQIAEKAARFGVKPEHWQSR